MGNNLSWQKQWFKSQIRYNKPDTKLTLSRAHKGSKVLLKVGKGKWSKAVKKDVSKKICLDPGKSVVVHFKIIAESKKNTAAIRKANGVKELLPMSIGNTTSSAIMPPTIPTAQPFPEMAPMVSGVDTSARRAS